MHIYIYAFTIAFPVYIFIHKNKYKFKLHSLNMFEMNCYHRQTERVYIKTLK